MKKTVNLLDAQTAQLFYYLNDDFSIRYILSVKIFSIIMYREVYIDKKV